MKLIRSLSLRTLPIALIFFYSLTISAQTSNVAPWVTQPVDPKIVVTLRGNTHPLARPEYDQGAAPDSLPMERMLLVLQRSPGQEAALRKLLDEQPIKSSPNFHKWLTPEEFGQQFGPADADLQAVTDWLTTEGFQVKRVAAGRTVIEFSGTAGEVRQGLGTEIHKFAVNGKEHWANASDPQIPAALAPVVAGIASLNNFPLTPMTQRLGTFRRSKATGEVQPLFTFPVSCGSGEGTCYYFAVGPADFATIYNVAPLWSAGIDGTGQTIAVVGETNINPQDVADFRTMFSLPANPPNIILNGPDPGIIDEETEADLDVQWSGAVAKGATIDLVVSESTESTPGVDLSALCIIDNNLAPIMSESYSACEAELGVAGNQFHNNLWEQAASQGITVLLSAGDSGSAGCDSVNFGETAAQYGLAVSGLASTPFNVAVGGTDFNVDASNALTYWSLTNSSPSQSSALSYIPESTWNDSCADSGSLNACTPPPDTTLLGYGFDLIAGGGGSSSCINPSGTFPNVTCSENYSKPSWQSGVGVPNDNARDIPDVSLFAADGMHYSFYIICQMDENSVAGGYSKSCDLDPPYLDFQGASGTSASVQAFAGIMALVNQKAGERQGNANYVLYPMAAQSGASCNSSTAAVTNAGCVFYDVTVGNNSVICQGGTPNCSSTTSGQYGITESGGAAAYPTTTGYDLATGLGSVNVANLVNNWTSNFAPSKTTLSLSTKPITDPITLTHGQPINFTINVTSGSGTPSGDVSLIAQTGNSSSKVTGIGPFTLSGGTLSNSTTMFPGGSYKLTAHYAGNGTFGASDSTPGIPVVVGKESSRTEVRLVKLSATTPPVYSVTTAPYGSPYVLRMDVTNSSGQPCPSPTTGLISYPCPTGALTVSPVPTDANPPPGTIPGSYTLNSEGYAEDQPIQLSPGTYPFVAKYAGDISYGASTSPTVPITITKASTTTTFTGLPSSSVGEMVSIDITINTQSSGAGPTGTVQMLCNGKPLGSPATVYGTPYLPSTGAYATGSAGFVEILFPPGTDRITLQYSGDSNYSASTSAPATILFTDFSLSVNPTTINISAPGKSGTSTITLTPLGGFTGQVALSCTTYWYPNVPCTISPSSVSLSGSSAVTAMLTITTTAPVGAVVPTPPRRAPPSFGLPVGWPWLLAGLLALATLMSLASARWRPTVLLFATVLLLVALWVACGGGGGGGGSNPSPTPTPIASLSPVSLSFNQQMSGTSSPSQSVTLANSGTAALSLSSIALGGANPADFAQTNNCSSSVAEGANCTINVNFAPTAAGSSSALLSVTDNASGSPQTVSLTGTGVAPATTVKLSPSTLAFGQENMDGAPVPKTVTLSNTGKATLSISSIAITGDTGGNFDETNNCGSSVAVGANCIISVQFAPVTTGAVSAFLSVADNATGSPQTVSLSGTGLPQATAPGTYSDTVSGSSGQYAYHDVGITINVQ